MLAHELRNPLAAIWAALPVLEENESYTDDQQRALQVLERQSGQLKRLIDDLSASDRSAVDCVIASGWYELALRVRVAFDPVDALGALDDFHSL